MGIYEPKSTCMSVRSCNATFALKIVGMHVVRFIETIRLNLLDVLLYLSIGMRWFLNVSGIYKVGLSLFFPDEVK